METEPDRGPFWTYLDLALFICLAVPSFVAGIYIVKVLIRLIPALHSGKAAELLTAQFLGYGLWFGCLAFLLRTRYDKGLWTAIPWKSSVSDVIPALSIGVLLALAVGLMGTLLRAPQMDSTLLDLMNDRFSIVVVAFFATTLGPFCEELAFRGFLLPLLVRSLGAAGGILLTALPFALLHGPQYHWSWQHMVLLSAVGCAFGWARFRTGSIAIPTMMHVSYNATFMGAFMASKREYF